MAEGFNHEWLRVLRRLRGMGFWHGEWSGDGPGGEKMAAIEMACLNRGIVGCRRALGPTDAPEAHQ